METRPHRANTSLLKYTQSVTFRTFHTLFLDATAKDSDFTELLISTATSTEGVTLLLQGCGFMCRCRGKFRKIIHKNIYIYKKQQLANTKRRKQKKHVLTFGGEALCSERDRPVPQ